MLEVKNLVKQYSGKGGVVVKALDDVSVKFPETGMVFLLGKSGSGKSTLLNVAGGLDKPDGGEIIVKGRSSKDFSAADFDSYRNTFVGFVFQEYNILNEFTIEQNIALALQLQNKPNDKKAVAELLEQVDLSGFAKRKPNTLSGGQKQRVAIARALIKNPEIIMADEPTGALDSNTGKQVLDTLKKLSQTKLVIVVSHDREFAEYYGDRIIELKDGQILSDVSKTYLTPDDDTKNVQLVGEDTITVKNAEDITEKDVKEIVAMLKKNGGEAVITASKREIPDVKRACKINESGSRESFKNTEKVDIKEYDGRQTKFIKSKLPMGHAVKMGASGLKSKPIRLIFTVILAVVAFVMFGVASTFMLYDPSYSITKAMEVADYPNVAVGKYYDAVYENVKINNKTGEETVTYSREEQYQTRFTPEDIAAKNKEGLNFAGVFNFTNGRNESGKTFSVTLVDDGTFAQVSVKKSAQYYYPVNYAMGFSDCGENYMTANGFTCVAGAYPADKTQIAVPEYIANLFVNTEGSGITNLSDIVGKKLRLNIGNGESKDFTVTAVYKVGEIPSKYDDLKNVTTAISEQQDQAKYSLTKSLQDFIAHSFHTVLFVSGDFYDAYKDLIRNDDNNDYIQSEYIKSLYITDSVIDPEYSDVERFYSYFTEKTVGSYSGKFKFYDTDGAEKTFSVPSESEVYFNYKKCIQNICDRYGYKLSEYAKFDAAVKTALEDGDFDNIKNNYYNGNNAETVLGFILTYYKTVAYKNYIYEAAGNLNYKSDYVKPDGFSDAYNKLNNFINSDGEEPTLTEWEILFTAVSDDYKNTFPQRYYYLFAEEMYNIDYSVFGEELKGSVDQMRWGNLSDEDFSAILAIINEKYSDITGKTLPDDITENYFAISLRSGQRNIYYKDKKGNIGTLTVAGFFKVNSSSIETDYLISSSFLENHGIKENRGGENEYTWKSRYKTDYVEPENAKYNFIVSKTQNTQAQISAVLAADGAISYKINNNVCRELDMFLDMINELKTVFLIVALVVGGFAALMLLNFISVSISSKRKDIGILRAVGARGSDVFKIFFAESFIIAIICFVLAVVGSFIVCYELNKSLVNVVNMQLLNFSVINVGLILGVSLVVSIIATFLPVFFAAKKSPVESIRAL